MRAWLALAALLGAGACAAAETLTLADGRVLTLDIRKPAGATGRLPAIMLFGGFQGAATVLDKVRADTPVIWASFNYPYAPPRKFEFPQSLATAPQMRAAIHGSIDGVGALYQYLRARADVDPARITLAGASAGAPVATIAGARTGVPGVVLVQGFGEPALVIQHLLDRRVGTYAARYLSGPAWLFAQWALWYCEAPSVEDHAARLTARQKVLMVTARDDDFVPRRASDALWQALEASASQHEKLELPGRHLRGQPEQIAGILERSLTWLRAQDLIVSKGD